MSTKSVIKLKKNKALDLMWHEESTVVFKDKLAIGRFSEGEFIPFDDITLELCENNKFKYDQSLLHQEAEQEASDDSEDSQTENQTETKENPQTESNTETEEKQILHVEHHSTNQPESQSIREIISCHQSKILSYFDSIMLKHTEEVTELKNDIVRLKSSLQSLENEKQSLQNSLSGIRSILSGGNITS